jgi:membrane protease YdiL (CAAX protease family)
MLALYVAVAGVASLVLTFWLVPERLFALPRFNTGLWLVIMIAYPLVSAVPQEIVFRALFFERYGALFPDLRWAILANAGLFGLAHLFYGNWPAVVLTAVGGGIFAWAYAHRRSFGFACVLHAVSGQIVFTSGLGVFFYHGAIGQV